MRTPNLAATLIATLLAAAPAHAADTTKREGSFGKGTGALLTKEQLRTCMNQQAHLAQRSEAMLTEQAALTATKAEIGRSGEALKAKLDSVDRTSADAVAAYNDEAQARDKAIDAYQDRVAAFNASVDAAKVERDAYGPACANRRFFADDEIAIRKEKAK